MSESFTWIDPDGNVTILNVLVGSNGYGFFPIGLLEQDSPLTPGAVLSRVTVKPRDVDLPVIIQAADRATLLTARKSLEYAMNPLRGISTLRIRREDGTVRDLKCVYKSGLEGMGDNGFLKHWITTLTLRAMDPNFYDPTPTILSFNPQGYQVNFFPFFPLQLNNTGSVYQFTVNNDGEDCWPVWIITGPAQNIYLKNLTSGKQISFSTNLADSSQILSIDVRPGKKTASVNGVSVFNQLVSGFQMWPIQRGSNLIEVGMNNASERTLVNLSYTKAYRSA